MSPDGVASNMNVMSTVERSDDEPMRLHFGMRGLLLFTAATGAVMALAVALASPEIVLVAALAWIGWLTWRFDVASRGPLAVSVIGCLVLIGALAIARNNAGLFGAIAMLQLASVGTIILAIGGVSFLLAAFVQEQTRRVRGNVLAFAVTVVTWFTWLIVGLGSIGMMHRTEEARRAVEDARVLQQLVDDTQRITRDLGRIPEDEQELVTLLGRPMPTVYDDGGETPVSYQRRGADAYYFMYTTWSYDYVYESSRPDVGWARHVW